MSQVSEVTPKSPVVLRFPSTTTCSTSSGSVVPYQKVDWSDFNLQEGLFNGIYRDPLAYWTSETGNDHKFAISKYGYDYDDESRYVLQVVQGHVNGVKDLAVIILSYTYLYDYFPINCRKGMYIFNWFGFMQLEVPEANMIVYKPKDFYFHACKIDYQEKVVDYMNQRILIHRVLDAEELEAKGFGPAEEIYTTQWQTRKEFISRIYGTYNNVEEEWLRDAIWELRTAVIYNVDPHTFQLKDKVGFYGIWLQDYTIQVDNEIIFVIDDAELIQDPVPWKSLPIWRQDLIPVPQNSVTL